MQESSHNSRFIINLNEDAGLLKIKKRMTDLVQLEEELQIRLTDIYVIWSDEKKSILHDPMTNKPVNNRNKALLVTAAKAFNGRIVNGKEARDLLIKHQSQ